MGSGYVDITGITATSDDTIVITFSNTVDLGITNDSFTFVIYPTTAPGSPLPIFPWLSFPNDGSASGGVVRYSDSTIQPSTNYTVSITANTTGATSSASANTLMACVAAGTLITMADGACQPIEDVKTGDWVRTHGGGRTVVTGTMLTGSGARPPCVLRAGTAGATADLWLTPNHGYYESEAEYVTGAPPRFAAVLEGADADAVAALPHVRFANVRLENGGIFFANGVAVVGMY